MATLRRIEEIEAWQKARELTRAVYACSKSGAFSKDFGLREQVRRAALSVMANIGEGFERGGNAEFAQFLAMAKGSAGEVEVHLYVALDQGYITREQFEDLRSLVESTKNLIGGVMGYLRRSGMKGAKYR